MAEHTTLPGLAVGTIVVSALALVLSAGRGEGQSDPKLPIPAANRPAQAPVAVRVVGRASAGREVFRFETFGNEGFWTDAMRMPKGMMDAKVTPLQALQIGLLVDIDAVPGAMRDAMMAELKTDLSPQKAPMLHDPAITVKLIEANAVVGIVPKDSNGDGRIDIAGGDKVGVSCAICHTVTDKSVHEVPGAGSIGKIIDGPAALVLNVGKLLATAANSRAYYPNLQLTLGGKTIGRAPKGLTPDSTEAEVDAYLTNPAFYPVGTFDETQDGVGNPVINTPLFRQDLAAPFGTAGEFALLVDISNASYTTNLDPTNLLTPEGRKFLKMKAGANGEQLANDYAKILADTGVTGFPFVTAAVVGKTGDPASPVGRRVDDQKLADMKAYLESLPAPKGAKVDPKVAARGRDLFNANCTSCHNKDQSRPVRATLVDMKRIWPGYEPEVMARRDPPLTPVQNSPGGFDDKMIVIDASDRGDKRGNALPLLLDLDRRTVLLHDVSVNGFESLLDPIRGEAAPHPFYIADPRQRSEVIQFLRGLETRRQGGGAARR
jgi:mono/diheme cytochrome c family protein